VIIAEQDDFCAAEFMIKFFGRGYGFIRGEGFVEFPQIFVARFGMAFADLALNPSQGAQLPGAAATRLQQR
jgi:hypothetical protein